jgi:hypothetical protein
MNWQNITAKDLQKVVRKLDLGSGISKRGKHPVYWYYLDGKKTLRVTMPNVHGGSSAVSTGFLDSIRENLRVTRSQFVDLVSCPLSAEEYEQIVRTNLPRSAKLDE